MNALAKASPSARTAASSRASAALAELVAPTTSVQARNAEPRRCTRTPSAKLGPWGAASARHVCRMFISFSLMFISFSLALVSCHRQPAVRLSPSRFFTITLRLFANFVLTNTCWRVSELRRQLVGHSNTCGCSTVFLYTTLLFGTSCSPTQFQLRGCTRLLVTRGAIHLLEHTKCCGQTRSYPQGAA